MEKPDFSEDDRILADLTDDTDADKPPFFNLI